MPTTITDTKAVEESAIVITAAYTDENGDAVTPSAATWSLCDEAGTIINSREDVAISSPTTSDDILLTGDDLAITETTYEVYRYLIIDYTYTSADHGAVNARDQVKFSVLKTKV